ncbi:major facilitator transporter [Mycolicibacterium smegmatis]|uniref:General substrate transporter:Major facilitator superfamily MFS_1 n=2 Tax=Mycolicibacterium smegmatis TaxID=1772 RepID=I7FFF5_MYCS2|nr:General substrate transporter:Major facilitator superfamily MFS_1 [Mycolicibacterium smegmatis MC2 155]AIU13025.1 major facilitator transporter [Mycolicibacterium smegmatis]AIU06400.1 major facilitator transporter [Mycolicibacterium smegmatis MC2 155]AIU19649.1 major facilitator transporter [Mycolicibacterium smegmatis]MBE9618414.1 MFS transporter [Mycolicibacterium smegmatis]
MASSPRPLAATNATSPASAAPPTSRRTMLALGLGNTLEWYDWMIFGLLAAYLGPQFFAPQDSVSATLDTLAVFAVGFVMRPLGGVLLGNLADRIGRRRVMLLSVSLMAVTTLVIAVMPTYDTIGVWAGVLLLVLRILQGVSTGIEAPLSTAYAVEVNPAGHEGRAAGYISFFVNFGILLASLVSFLTSYFLGGDEMAAWGWRVPMLFGAAMGFFVLYLRRTLPETLHDEEKAEQNAGTWGGVLKHWIGLLAMIFVVGAAQAYNYAWNVGLPSLARSTFNEDPTRIFAATTAFGVILLIGSIVTGRLADRITLSKAFIGTRLLAIPAVFMMLLYAGPGMSTFTVVLLVGGVFLVANMTLYNVVSTSLMPKYCRATGTSLGYGLAVAAFGGTASYLLVWLQRIGQLWVFPAYTATLAAISVVLYVIARRKSGIFAGK